MTIPNRLVAVAILLGPIAAGCGGKQEPPAPPPPMAQAASPAAETPASPAAETSMASPAPSAQASPVPVRDAMRPAVPAAAVPTTTLAPTRPTPAPATVATTPQAASSPSPRPAETATAPPSPAAKLPKRPQPRKVALPAKLGTVTFDHQKHAEALAIPCAQCHHASRPAKPLAAEQQACRDCHTSPAAAPMKTSLQAAFHDPKASAGTCLTCHKEAVAKGKQAPVRCMDCHKK